MKVYDCFMFYNEFELLELRLKSLWDVVDYFVLVEADRGHTNIPEPFFFQENKERFKEFLPKIRHIMVKLDLPYKGTGDWSLENAHRNAISEGIKDAAPDDLIFISDLDEIWAPDVLQRINNRQTPVFANYPLPATPPRFGGQRLSVPCQLMVHAVDLLEVSPISMDQQLLYYYFDWAPKQGTWQGTILTKRKNLTTPQDFRNLRTVFPRVLNGGYHFSWMGGVEKIINKMNSIVDANEINKNSDEKFSNKNHIEDVIKNGKDLFNRKGIPASELVNFNIENIKLPYLSEFVKKYPNFLRQR